MALHIKVNILDYLFYSRTPPAKIDRGDFEVPSAYVPALQILRDAGVSLSWDRRKQSICIMFKERELGRVSTFRRERTDWLNELVIDLKELADQPEKYGLPALKRE